MDKATRKSIIATCIALTAVLSTVVLLAVGIYVIVQRFATDRETLWFYLGAVLAGLFGSIREIADKGSGR